MGNACHVHEGDVASASLNVSHVGAVDAGDLG